MGRRPFPLLYWTVIGIITYIFFPLGLIVLAFALIATGIDMRYRALSRRAWVDGMATLASGVIVFGLTLAILLTMIFWSASRFRSDGVDGSTAPTPTIFRSPAG